MGLGLIRSNFVGPRKFVRGRGTIKNSLQKKGWKALTPTSREREIRVVQMERGKSDICGALKASGLRRPGGEKEEGDQSKTQRGNSPRLKTRRGISRQRGETITTMRKKKVNLTRK